MNKLRSVKLWLTVTVLLAMIALNVCGTVTGDQLLDIIKWLMGFYFFGNVATKAVTRGQDK